MKCIECGYYYKTEEDRYPCCHFEGPEGWAPCEQEEDIEEEEPDLDEKEIKWECLIDGSEYDTEEEAREAARERVDFDDVCAQIGNDITYEDLIKELARLDSPIYYQLLEAAENQVFEDYFSTIEASEEDE